VGEFTTCAVGYVGLCLLGGLAYAVVVLAVCLLHVEAARAAGVLVRQAFAVPVRRPLSVGVVAFLPLGAALALYPRLRVHGARLW
jgi:hypothetical protein